MKFLVYFFLILQIQSEVKSSSLSFINIIPSIIANGRFVKENLINSKYVLQPVLPKISVDLTLNTNGSNCSRDIQLFARDLVSQQTWALKSIFIYCVFFL